MYIFETGRTSVRQYNLLDEDFFYQLSSNEQVMRYIRPVVSREDSNKLLAQNIQLYSSIPNTGRWAVFEKATGSFMGSFSVLSMESDNTKLHIGYALLPQYWGLGYATELLRQGLLFFFANHATDILYAITEEPNMGSQKVLAKCGFTCQGRQKEKGKDLLMFVLRRHEMQPQ